MDGFKIKKRKSLLLLAISLAFLFCFSNIGFAQDSKFQKQTFFEVGLSHSYNSEWDRQSELFLIYGKQRSEIYSQGWGLGVDFLWDGVGLPLFSEWRFNFSNKKSPFFCNLRAGVNLQFVDWGLDSGGPLFGAGIGKSFVLSQNTSLSPFVRGEYSPQFAVGAGVFHNLSIGLGVSVRF